MKIIENFYRSFFINELFKFKNKTGINPTHCIIDSEIYDKLVREIIIGSWDFTTDKELVYHGVKFKKGNGTQLFYFYKE